MKMRTLAALTAMALATTLAACGQQSQQAADKAKESAAKLAPAGVLYAPEMREPIVAPVATARKQKGAGR